jgi:hypothetical protein
MKMELRDSLPQRFAKITTTGVSLYRGCARNCWIKLIPSHPEAAKTAVWARPIAKPAWRG